MRKWLMALALLSLGVVNLSINVDLATPAALAQTSSCDPNDLTFCCTNGDPCCVNGQWTCTCGS